MAHVNIHGDGSVKVFRGTDPNGPWILLGSTPDGVNAQTFVDSVVGKSIANDPLNLYEEILVVKVIGLTRRAEALAATAETVGEWELAQRALNPNADPQTAYND